MLPQGSALNTCNFGAFFTGEPSKIELRSENHNPRQSNEDLTPYCSTGTPGNMWACAQESSKKYLISSELKRTKGAGR